MAKPARLLALGRRDYRSTLELQRAIHAKVATGDVPDTWIFVEHNPVITLGRAAKRENVHVSTEALAELGVDLVETERGGDVTYHGPGQLVVYPILKLERFREVLPLVRSLEAAAIAACAHFGITAARWSEHSGVWVDRNQICAIGLTVRAMTSMHGIALNVSTRLDYDRLITPCGLSDRGITSLENESAAQVSLDAAVAALHVKLCSEFDLIFSSIDEKDALYSGKLNQ